MNILLYYIYYRFTSLDSIHSYYSNFVPHRCLTGNASHRYTPKRATVGLKIYSRNKKPQLILGGDPEEPPSIVKEVQTPESKAFADHCWTKGISLHDAVNSLNTLPEEESGSMLDNILYENTPDTQTTPDERGQSFPESPSYRTQSDTLPVGTVELDPIVEDGLSDEELEDEGECLEVDFGLLTGREISVVLALMKEKVKNRGKEFKSELLRSAREDENFYLKGPKVEDKIEELDKIADLFLRLNETVGRPPLDLKWIPVLESKIYKFLRERNYTLSRSTWTEDSLILVLKEQNLSEKEVSRAHDLVHGYLKDIALTEGLRGLSNIGLMLSGDDPHFM